MGSHAERKKRSIKRKSRKRLGAKKGRPKSLNLTPATVRSRASAKARQFNRPKRRKAP